MQLPSHHPAKSFPRSKWRPLLRLECSRAYAAASTSTAQRTKLSVLAISHLTVDLLNSQISHQFSEHGLGAKVFFRDRPSRAAVLLVIRVNRLKRGQDLVHRIEGK